MPHNNSQIFSVRIKVLKSNGHSITIMIIQDKYDKLKKSVTIPEKQNEVVLLFCST